MIELKALLSTPTTTSTNSKLSVFKLPAIKFSKQHHNNKPALEAGFLSSSEDLYNTSSKNNSTNTSQATNLFSDPTTQSMNAKKKINTNSTTHILSARQKSKPNHNNNRKKSNETSNFTCYISNLSSNTDLEKEYQQSKNTNNHARQGITSVIEKDTIKSKPGKKHLNTTNTNINSPVQLTNNINEDIRSDSNNKQSSSSPSFRFLPTFKPTKGDNGRFLNFSSRLNSPKVLNSNKLVSSRINISGFAGGSSDNNSSNSAACQPNYNQLRHCPRPSLGAIEKIMQESFENDEIELWNKETERYFTENISPFERTVVYYSKSNKVDAKEATPKIMGNQQPLAKQQSAIETNGSATSNFTRFARSDNLSLRGSTTRLSKWGSIVGLRDSIRNLTSCVGIRSSTVINQQQQPNLRPMVQDNSESHESMRNPNKKMIEEEYSSQNKTNFYKNQRSILLLPSSLAAPNQDTNSNNYNNNRAVNIADSKIKIKKKSKVKHHTSQLNGNSTGTSNLSASTDYLSSNQQRALLTDEQAQDEESKRDVLDMIEKVQSNGFDDQRYKQPSNIHAGSSATEFLSKFPTISNYPNDSSSSSNNSKGANSRRPPTIPLIHHNPSKPSIIYQNQLHQPTSPTSPSSKSNDTSKTQNQNKQQPAKSMLNKKHSSPELPTSPTQLKALSNNMSAEERLIQLISSSTHQQQQLPIVSLPDSDSYWSEGWKCSTDMENNNNDLSIVSSTSSPVSSSSASPLSSASSSPSSFFQSNSSTSSQHLQASNKKTPSQVQVESMTELSPEYLEAFNDKEHLVFYGHDSQDMPVILSYKTEPCTSPDNHDTNLRAVLRTKEKNYCMLIPLVNLNMNSIAENCDNIQITPALVTRAISPDIKMKFFYPLMDLNGFKLIKNFDNHTHNKNLKFGVIYMKKGQTTEEELFSNQEHSESFDKFLGLLGQRIKLKGHQGFRGGLDTVNGQTGDYSVYDKFNTKEIMFHVSTLLPFSKSDQQQLERKRHIGNDIVAIVFQEDNTPFAPDMIASNFLHTFIVVQRFNEPNEGKEKYRVSVIARKDVPNFSPPITAEGIYENDDSFKEWLMNKLLNAEQACYKAEKFKKLNERTRSALFGALYHDLHERNMRIMQSVFFNQQVEEDSNSASSVHSSFSSRVLEHSNSGSNLLGSPTAQTGSNQNIHQTGTQSAAFKFSLLNTVRKAFKKSEPIKQAVPVSQAQLHRPASQTQSTPTPTLKSPSKTDVHRGSFSHDYPGHEPQPVGRNRSSTFDASNSYNKSQSLLSKNQLEPQQANVMFSNRKEQKTADRLSKHIDYGSHLYGKIGSIDSLNNNDNYSHGFRQNPNGPNSHQQSMPSSRDSGKQQAIKPKTLNLNNMSLSDLSNSVRYKTNNSPFASYAESHRSGSSSPESQTNGSIQSKKQFGRLTKNSLMKSATSIRNDDSDTGMGSLTPNSSGLSSASTTDFYSTNLHHNHHSMIIK